MTTDVEIQLKTCHGCNGTGWVTVHDRNGSARAVICPVCGGSRHINDYPTYPYPVYPYYGEPIVTCKWRHR